VQPREAVTGFHRGRPADATRIVVCLLDRPENPSRRAENSYLTPSRAGGNNGADKAGPRGD
jgi:hypothetical protein